MYKSKDSSIIELTKQNDRLAIINQIAKSISVKMSYQDILEQVALPLKKAIPCEQLSICIWENNNLVIKAGLPKMRKLIKIGHIFDKKNTAVMKAVLEKRCYSRQDISKYEDKYVPENDQLYELGIKSDVITPLLVNDQAIGALAIGSSVEYAYSEDDLVFFQQLADQIAICLDNNRLYNMTLQVKQEWEDTFKAVPDLLYVVDSDFNILQSNHAIGKLSGKGTSHNCYGVLPICGKGIGACPVEDVFATGEESFKEVVNDCLQKIFTYNAYPIFNKDGECSRAVVYVRDVTEKRQIESQIFQSAKLAAIGEMAAGVAHELNSPLTAVIGNANLLLCYFKMDDDFKKLVTDIKSCGQRCKRIIQNLLAFSRPDNSEQEQISINRVIESSLSLVQYQIEKSQITLNKSLKSGLPTIMGNYQRLEEVVVNLLLNSMDAVADVTTKQITITTDSVLQGNGEPGLQITVSDTGCGINAQDIEHIFDPFFTTKERLGGTGLGLSVSMGTIKAHEGTINVYSIVGEGSNFTVLLPL